RHCILNRKQRSLPEKRPINTGIHFSLATKHKITQVGANQWNEPAATGIHFFSKTRLIAIEVGSQIGVGFALARKKEYDRTLLCNGTNRLFLGTSKRCNS